MEEQLKVLLERNLTLLVENKVSVEQRARVLQEVERLARLLHNEQKMALEEERADLAEEEHDLSVRRYELEDRKANLDEKRFEAGLEKDEQARADELERAEKEAKRAKRDKIIDVVMKIVGAIGSFGALFAGKFYDRMFDSNWLDKLLAFEKDEIFSTATTKEFVRDLISGIFRKR